MEPITVHVHAWDPISAAGVVSELRPRPEVRVVGSQDADRAAVVVVVADAVDDEALKLLSLPRVVGVEPRLVVRASSGAGS